MRVLITNITLASRTGTEIVVRDLALGLARRGHRPTVYTPKLGPIVDELRAGGIPVHDRLAGIAEPPDLIHGHHAPETLKALLAFPGVPGLFVSHDRRSWPDEAPKFPGRLSYVAVDEPNRARLVRELGLDPGDVTLFPNALDLVRFRPRSPLPPRPLRALLFANLVEEGPELELFRAVCVARGLELEVLGAGVGREVAAPELELGRFDLVFAKARAAMEGIVVGCAVVLFDDGRLGPAVRAADVDRLLPMNFGGTAIETPLDAAALGARIDAYDPADAALAAERLRPKVDLECALDRWLVLYEALVARARGVRFDPEAELRAVALWLERWGPRLGGDTFEGLTAGLRVELRVERARLEEALAATARAERELAELRRRLAAAATRGLDLGAEDSI